MSFDSSSVSPLAPRQPPTAAPAVSPIPSVSASAASSRRPQSPGTAEAKDLAAHEVTAGATSSGAAAAADQVGESALQRQIPKRTWMQNIHLEGLRDDERPVAQELNQFIYRYFDFERLKAAMLPTKFTWLKQKLLTVQVLSLVDRFTICRLIMQVHRVHASQQDASKTRPLSSEWPNTLEDNEKVLREIESWEERSQECAVFREPIDQYMGMVDRILDHDNEIISTIEQEKNRLYLLGVRDERQKLQGAAVVLHDVVDAKSLYISTIVSGYWNINPQIDPSQLYVKGVGVALVEEMIAFSLRTGRLGRLTALVPSQAEDFYKKIYFIKSAVQNAEANGESFQYEFPLRALVPFLEKYGGRIEFSL